MKQRTVGRHTEAGTHKEGKLLPCLISNQGKSSISLLPAMAMTVADETKKDKKLRIRPKLKPVRSESDRSSASGADDWDFDIFRPATGGERQQLSAESQSGAGTSRDMLASSSVKDVPSDTSGINENIPNMSPPTIVVTQKTTIQPTLSSTPATTNRIQPRSPYRAPHSPDADDYDAFGFVLSRGNCRSEESLKHSVAEEAAPKKASLIPLTSPISMRRGDSYISDDSSSSDSLSSHSHGQIRTNAMVEGALREHEPAKTQNSRRRVVNDHSFSSSDSSSDGVEHHAVPRSPLSHYNQHSNSGSQTRLSTSTPFDHETFSPENQTVTHALRKPNVSMHELRPDSNESLPLLSGRYPPVQQSDTPTPPIQHFYTSPSKARLAVTTVPSIASKPHAQHDSSFLKSLRDDFMRADSLASVTASEGTFNSPQRSAFGKPPNRAERMMTSPPRDFVTATFSPGRSNASSNLAYSDRSEHSLNEPMNLTCLCNVANSDAARAEKQSLQWIVVLLSLLNLLSGWTCYSVAPISTLARSKLGLDPENLVALFLGANVLGRVVEPVISKRLGLRRTVLFGSLLLCVGSIVKSGSALKTDHLNTQLYLGFFLTGVSHPIYMCTSIASVWFPDLEGAAPFALHGYQLGTACAFVFGALLVKNSDDILPYFHLLSVISIVLFVAVAMQFDEVPPTLPLETAETVLRREGSRTTTRSRSGDSDAGHLSPGWTKSLTGRRTQQKCEQLGRDARELPKIPLLPSPLSASFGSFDPPTEHSMKNNDTNDALLCVTHAQGTARAITSGFYGSVNAPNTAKSTISDLNDDVGDISPFPHLEPSEDKRSAVMDHVQTEGAPCHLDIHIEGDPIWKSLQACFSHKGFSHCALAFSASGITLNVISTFMDDLVRLSEPRQKYVGIVGGMFQVSGMVSSIMCKGLTDKAEKNYFVIIGLLALSALTLALCSANIFSGELFWLNLLMLAVFVTPIQTLCSKLGALIMHPVSENTVLANQQLFSNLLSAASIPIHREIKKLVHKGATYSISYSFYLLASIHVFGAIYFGTFNVQQFYVQRLCQKIEKQEKKLCEEMKAGDEELGKTNSSKPRYST